jgi:hypothetical protein
MAVFVTLSEGDECETSRPFLVVDDQQVARDVARVIARRLGVSVPTPRAAGAPVVALRRDEPCGGSR